MTENVEQTTANTPVEGAQDATAQAVAAAAQLANAKPAEEAVPVEGQVKGNDTTSEDGQADSTDKKVGAPEKYEDFTFPEGVEPDTAVIEEFTTFAKEFNLNQEQAQKLIDLDNKRQTEAYEKQLSAWETTQTEWQDKVKADKEIGGAKFDQSMADAVKAVKALGTPALMEALETTGMGNHPEMIRIFTRIGKAMGEDTVRVGAGTAGQGPKDPASILFPNQGK